MSYEFSHVLKNLLCAHAVEDPYANSVKECYVLTPTHLEYGLFTRPDRRARNGYWRPLGDGKKFCMNGFVGFKETLCFYEGELGHGRKTSWKMIEYKMRRHECTTECTHRRGRVLHYTCFGYS